jgi:iron complex transport system permease protein
VTRLLSRARPASAPGHLAGRTALILLVGASAVLVASVIGLGLGSHPISPGTVISALVNYDPSINDHLIVVRSRLPRQVLGILVGLALGTAGVLMQSITRNALAEPGLLGLNAGAAFAVVIGIAYFGVGSAAGYLWFALAGAALAAVAVYFIGTARRSSATPVRMLLAGAAVATATMAVSGAILASHERAFDQFRYWDVGSLQGRDWSIILTVLPLIAAAVVVSLALIRPLNAIALGDEAARALGAATGRIRIVAAIAIVLLAGSATAAAGPIAFIGLAAPHMARLVVGPDLRVLIPATMVCSPALLLLADAFGRWVIAPAEIPTGVAAAIFGGPVFVALVRSRGSRV